MITITPKNTSSNDLLAPDLEVTVSPYAICVGELWTYG